MSDFPLSLFNFIKAVDGEAVELLGEYTFPMVFSLLADGFLTFFMIYFLAKWIFDILKSVGKGGKR